MFDIKRTFNSEREKPVEIELFSLRDGFPRQPSGVVVRGGGVVGETVQGHSLLGHELAGALVCLGVVDTNTAEHSERFHCQDIFLVKSFAIKLKVLVDVSIIGIVLTGSPCL